MTEEQEKLVQSLFSEIQGLRKEVSIVANALSYKTTDSKKKDSIQDIANSLLAQSVLKGKGNRKHN